MSFCSNCGIKQNAGVKFCQGCGQPASSGNAQNAPSTQPPEVNVQSFNTGPATKANHENTRIAGSVKKELLQLSNTFFSLYLASFLLMKVQTEGGFKSLLADAGDEQGLMLIVIFVLLAIIVGVTYLTVRVQGINKEKPGWVLGTLIVLAGLTVFGWTDTNFSNFNWADWASEALNLAQLYLLFAIYQLLDKAKSGQD